MTYRKRKVVAAVVVAFGVTAAATALSVTPSFAEESGQQNGVEVVLSNVPTTFQGRDLTIKSVHLDKWVGSDLRMQLVQLGCVSIAPGEEVRVNTDPQVGPRDSLLAKYFPEKECIGGAIPGISADGFVPADANGEFQWDLAKTTRVDNG